MLRKFLTLATLFTIVSLTALCQSEQLTINLSSSSLPGVLTFENPKGSIKVTGPEYVFKSYNGNIIIRKK